jgi:hypothetical protein
VDLYHAREHLNDLGMQLAFMLGDASAGWLAERSAELDAGDIDALAAAALATSASSSPTFSRPLRHASKASAISPWSRQSSSGTSVVLKPLATLFSQASFCADRICIFPPLRMATSLTGGEHHRSFRRKNLHYPLDA